MEILRNSFGYAIQPDPEFAPAGTTGNSREYADLIGKTNPTPSTVTKKGRPIYAVDGMTQDWWATHPKPEPIEEPKPIEVPCEETKSIEETEKEKYNGAV